MLRPTISLKMADVKCVVLSYLCQLVLMSISSGKSFRNETENAFFRWLFYGLSW